MKQAYFKYFLALLLFGSNGVVASYIKMNSYEIVFFRTLTGSLFLLLLYLFSKRKGKRTTCRNRKHLFCILISGAAMGLSWMLLYEAYHQIGVSIATLAYYCGPVIVMALSPLLFREKLSKAKLLGFAAVLTGMFLANSADFLHNGFSVGLLCGVLAAVMYAVMVVFNKMASSITGLENAVLQLLVSFLTVAVFTFAKQGIGFLIQPQNLLPMLFLGIVNTGIGCFLYFSSIQQLSAGTVAVCGYLEPLSALIFAGIFLGEKLTVIQFIGAAFLISGAVASEYFNSRNVV
ncbi:DMT family transporter [uncultured Robinsoniella sp.]|uniref:DMT family transporter n=1 Tax=uncultured Robinsoniella sp. TaxID=904190 RepID=UPI00374F28AC